MFQKTAYMLLCKFVHSFVYFPFYSFPKRIPSEYSKKDDTDNIWWSWNWTPPTLLHREEGSGNELWIGSSFDSSNRTFLDEHNITHIVNVTSEIPNSYDDITYFNININDHKHSHFTAGDLINVCFFIRQFLISSSSKPQSLLVHCFGGRSRSVAVCCCYLMFYENKTFKDAYNDIAKKRTCSRLNTDFIKDIHQLFPEDNTILDFIDHP